MLIFDFYALDCNKYTLRCLQVVEHHGVTYSQVVPEENSLELYLQLFCNFAKKINK